MNGAQKVGKMAGTALLAGVMLAGLMSTMALGQSAAARYDNQIQTAVQQRLADKNQFRAVNASVEDGIVTLTGTVDLYQRKLDAAKAARKSATCSGCAEPDCRRRS